MGNLNAEQIKKALECCTNVGKGGLLDCKCGDCPYDIGKDDCKSLDEYALALVNLQEQRIKELTEENERLQAEITHLEGHREADIKAVKNLKAENERLKSVEFTCGFVKPHKVLECPIFDEIERTKADTVREMQERLTKEFNRMHITNFITVEVRQWIIDQIAKEMLEGIK